MDSATDKEFFEREMSALSLSYQKKIDRKLVNQYWEFLKRYSRDRLVVAFKDVVEIEEFFPSIATLLKYLKTTTKDQEEEPWPTFKEIRAPTNIAKDSLRLILRQLGDEPLSKEQYYQEMLRLHDKYPRARFLDYAQKYAQRVNLQTKED